MSKQLQPTSDAHKAAMENAADGLELPMLPKGYQFKTFEIYLGTQLDEPAYAMHDGRIIALNVPQNPAPILQMFGDDGPVFVAIDGQTHCTRIEESGLPAFPTTDLEELVNSFVGRE